MKRQATPGKKKKLEAVSDSRGIIAALACDQRQALRSLFGKIIGVDPENVPDERLVEFKKAVSRILTPHASAILLDPEYGLPRTRRDCYSPMRGPATTHQSADAYRNFWSNGPYSGLWKLEPIA